MMNGLRVPQPSPLAASHMPCFCQLIHWMSVGLQRAGCCLLPAALCLLPGGQPALIIFKLESALCAFSCAPSGQFKRDAAGSGCIVCLSICFCLRRRTHSRAHPTPSHSTPTHFSPLCASRSLEIAADCLTRSCTCGFHSPAFLSGKCVCPAHGTILCSHCHRSTLTLKCFGPSPSTPGYLSFLPPKQTQIPVQILGKQTETETERETQTQI